jgi:hypothetical protein
VKGALDKVKLHGERSQTAIYRALIRALCDTSEGHCRRHACVRGGNASSADFEFRAATGGLRAP